ncbi:MAG: hypothetical protein ACR2JJ_12460 [Sphingomicrobium sp.]
MSEQQTPNISSGPLVRWPFVLAGLGALGVALARTILGGRNDLPLLVSNLERPAMAAVIYINWYALNLAYATLGVALLVGTVLHRSAARTIGVVAAIIFGAACALFMYFVLQTTGSPFTFFPWIPLALTALLSAFAAWRV